MISSEVQRTLVKSPPELWAELSDPAALARHLGELGEIRITRAEPEKRVEWEAEKASGTVLIKASGWGTKVTLSVSRELEPSEPACENPQATHEPTATAASDTVAGQAPLAEPEPGDLAEPIIETTNEAVAQPKRMTESEEASLALEQPVGESSAGSDTVVIVSPEPRRGFFARLFGRGKETSTAPPQSPSSLSPTVENERAHTQLISNEDSPTRTAMRSISAIESLQARFQAQTPPAAQDPEMPLRGVSEPITVDCKPDLEPSMASAAVDQSSEECEQASGLADIAGELRTAEAVAADEIRAVLTATLDRLGAAHHRPFSRS